MITESLLDIKKYIKGRVLYDEPMAKHTSFRVGGPAEVWAEPDDIDGIQACISLAKDRNIPVFVAGGGTNLLVRDEGIKGVVISMTSPKMKKVYYGDVKVSSTPAVRLGELIRSCADNSLGGLEFLAGVPGTVGGAVAMNAGARHYGKKDIWQSIGDFVHEIKAIDCDGNACIFTRKEFNFGYKISGLKGFIVTEIIFSLIKNDRESILSEYNKFLKNKKTTQDLSLPSAGCVFKNPAGVGKSAGELIDKCGLKGRRIGGAAVSRKHANFIVNAGGATAGDILSLIGIIKKEVRDKFSVELKLEIEVV
ncbi:MAG: UDP-N-acetylmuramate dehydrogenase [Candidatus Omnitrophota bacterium]|nr:UDP-N-acetylmuramate dehydrogenase [Candidatus Omnitrophota bacterium]